MRCKVQTVNRSHDAPQLLQLQETISLQRNEKWTDDKTKRCIRVVLMGGTVPTENLLTLKIYFLLLKSR